MENKASYKTWNESLISYVDSIKYMVPNLDPKQVEVALEVIDSCKELLIFTGVGQNGLIAAKVASTYNSLSIRSTSVDPVASLHGNMGLFRDEDVLIPISKSGNTAELVVFLEACHRVGYRNILGIHSNYGCKLEKYSRWSVYVPVLAEADHLEIAPTSSSVCYLAFLQSLAVHISSRRGLTLADFVRTHPGGTLGKTEVKE